MSTVERTIALLQLMRVETLSIMNDLMTDLLVGEANSWRPRQQVS